MSYINRIAVYSVIFVLGFTSFAVAVQKVVPGAVIHLDAREQNRREIAWRNLGLAGGKMPANDEVPEFEQGKIRIPALGINEDAKWYTATRKSETFGGPPDLLPKLQLEDWTMEVLIKRNGPKWPDLVVASQVLGFRARDRELQQFQVSLFGPDTGELIARFKGSPNKKGRWLIPEDLGLDIKEKEWHWIAFVFTNQKMVETYQDGEKVGMVEMDQDYDPDEPMWLSIFTSHDRDRNFNGSIAILRIYDRPLSRDELLQNITGKLAVEPTDKLTTTWARVKAHWQ